MTPESKIHIINGIGTTVLLSVISFLLYLVIQSNTREHNQIRDDLDGKVSNEILLQYIKSQDARWRQQIQVNSSINKDIDRLEDHMFTQRAKKKTNSLIAGGNYSLKNH